ncbi:MAG: hypothetical protein AAF411_14640 [Myxococcota bacterium]
MARSALCALVAALTGCSLGPFDAEGKACPCANDEEWRCLSGQCVAVEPCTPIVEIAEFRPSWSTDQAVRWEWAVRPLDVGQVPEDEEEDDDSIVTIAGVRVELAQAQADVASYEIDIAGDDGTFLTMDSESHPELRQFVLEQTGTGRDVSDSALLLGLEPNVTYTATFRANDRFGCADVSAPIIASTLRLQPPNVVDLFIGDDDDTDSALELGRQPGTTLERENGNTFVVHEPVNNTDAGCDAAASICTANVAIGRLNRALAINEGDFRNRAYVEFSLHYTGVTPSDFSRVQLTLESSTASNTYASARLTVPPTPEPVTIQVPLRELFNDGSALSHLDLETRMVTRFTFGGQFDETPAFGDTGRVIVDDVRIYY